MDRRAANLAAHGQLCSCATLSYEVRIVVTAQHMSAGQHAMQSEELTTE